MPSTSAASTAHTPTCLDTSIAIGLAAGVSASVAVAPYHFGIISVSTMFAAATTASGSERQERRHQRVRIDLLPAR